MNIHYTYPNEELWARDAWNQKISPLHALARYMAYSGIARFSLKERTPEEMEKLSHADLFSKAGYVSEETIRYWEEKGLYYCPSGAGDPFFVMLPSCVRDGSNRSPKILHVISCVEATNPYWTTEMFEAYRDYFEMAAQEQSMLIFTIASVPNRIDLVVIMIREIAQRYNVNYDNLYVDVSRLREAGKSLKEVPDFRYLDAEGNQMANPDDAVIPYGSLRIPALSFIGQWASKESLEFSNFTPGRIGKVIPFSYDRLVHSHVGRRMADAMRLEFDYDTAEDPAVVAQMEALGLECRYHETGNRGWVTVVPRSALDHPDKKLPCMMIMQEIAKVDPHSVLCAYSLWYEYLNIAAQGDLMLMFFALEDPDSNDLYMDLLEEATEMYPFLDRSRVYMTGHSHNGHYTLEFSRRHPEVLAGVATLGNPHGIMSVIDHARTVENAVEVMSKVDMPCINIDGEWENLYSCKELTADHRRKLTDEERIRSWQNRLVASRCPIRSAEEILAAPSSPDYATRKIGLPNDRSEVVYFEGDECYTADIKNVDGKVHLRLVTLENWPHATSAHAPWLSWSFLRQFARDQETGELVELFDKR